MSAVGQAKHRMLSPAFMASLLAACCLFDSRPAFAFLGQAMFGGRLGANGYKYHRFVIDNLSGSSGHAGTANLDFFINGALASESVTANTGGSIGGYNVTISTSSVYNSSYAGWRGIDNASTGYSNTWYSSTSTYSTSAPYQGSEWLQIYWGGASVAVTALNVMNCDSACGSNQLIKTWHLEGSNDGVTFVVINGTQQTFASPVAGSTTFHAW